MGQSLVKNYLHITFSTKNREPLIKPPYESELHSYLGGIANKLECPPIKVGGYNDHVHIACLLSKKVALVKLIEELKAHSSKWIKTLDSSLSNFYWQDGYGAFSVFSAVVGVFTNNTRLCLHAHDVLKAKGSKLREDLRRKAFELCYVLKASLHLVLYKY